MDIEKQIDERTTVYEEQFYVMLKEKGITFADYGRELAARDSPKFMSINTMGEMSSVPFPSHLELLTIGAHHRLLGRFSGPASEVLMQLPDGSRRDLSKILYEIVAKEHIELSSKHQALYDFITVYDSTIPDAPRQLF